MNKLLKNRVIVEAKKKIGNLFILQLVIHVWLVKRLHSFEGLRIPVAL